MKYDKTRLFLVSTMALASAGVAYSIRANTAADLQRVFLDPIDRAHSAEMIATILGVLLVPMLYVMVEKIIGLGGAKKHAPAQAASPHAVAAGHGQGGH